MYSGHTYSDVGTALPACLKWIPGATLTGLPWMSHKPGTVVSAGKIKPRLYVYSEHKYADAGTAFHLSALSGSLVPLSRDSLECRTSVLQWSCWEKHPVKQRHHVYSGRKYDDLVTAFHLSAWSDL